MPFGLAKLKDPFGSTNESLVTAICCDSRYAARAEPHLSPRERACLRTVSGTCRAPLVARTRKPLTCGGGEARSLAFEGKLISRAV